ncbi:MAG: PhzF family phenazine biosynthesis protein [Candidatus Midichloria sp.]|nr:MAG: PhzF family phenazine biosynthesis protein [Candidatus Midichloria sp.]
MQNITAGIDLSEAAFVKRFALYHYHIRWFTLSSEVQLCGHATVAATHVLINTKAEKNHTPIKFCYKL